MHSFADKKQESTQKANNTPGAGPRATLQLKDNRPQAKVAQQRVDAMVSHLPVQKKANNTGLPDKLKTGIENLSGHSMDDVKVHYNSSKPAQLQAHAYAQGTQIHIAPGQEKHLPHEAWHVVQQKQGRVSPTLQLKGGVNVNDNAGLEREADVMGGRALVNEQGSASKNAGRINSPLGTGIVQKAGIKTELGIAGDTLNSLQKETGGQKCYLIK